MTEQRAATVGKLSILRKRRREAQRRERERRERELAARYGALKVISLEPGQRS
ncbi:MAG: hypothetical protein KY469_09440 [Actinobacteria bacterium]|nr:hypothetical protein [Actinomycetota bacterium]